MAETLMNAMRELAGWLSLLVTIAGLVLSLAHVTRTRWAALLATGFAIEALVGAFYRVFAPLMARSVLSAGSFSLTYTITSLLGTLGTIGIVAGVIGLLFELKARQAAAR